MRKKRVKILRALYKNLGYDLENKNMWRNFKKFYKKGGVK